MTQCPKCGYVRRSKEIVSEDECPRCGIIYAKFIARPTAGQKQTTTANTSPLAKRSDPVPRAEQPRVYQVSKAFYLAVAGIGLCGMTAFFITAVFFTASQQEGWQVLQNAGILSLYTGTVTAVLWYKMWAAIQDGHARMTPGEALGRLCIPGYNLYWIFQVLPGFAADYNRYRHRHSIPGNTISAGAFRLFPSLTLTAIVLFLFGLTTSSVVNTSLSDAIFYGHLATVLAGGAVNIALTDTICRAINAIALDQGTVKTCITLPRDQAYAMILKEIRGMGHDRIREQPPNKIWVALPQRPAVWWFVLALGTLFYLIPGVLIYLFWKPEENLEIGIYPDKHHKNLCWVFGKSATKSGRKILDQLQEALPAQPVKPRAEEKPFATLSPPGETRAPLPPHNGQTHQETSPGESENEKTDSTKPLSFPWKPGLASGAVLLLLTSVIFFAVKPSEKKETLQTPVNSVAGSGQPGQERRSPRTTQWLHTLYAQFMEYATVSANHPLDDGALDEILSYGLPARLHDLRAKGDLRLLIKSDREFVIALHNGKDWVTIDQDARIEHTDTL